MGRRTYLRAPIGWLVIFYVASVCVTDAYPTDVCASYPCGPVGACYPDQTNPHGYSCRCDSGFNRPGDVGPCVDVDECSGAVNPCFPGTCVNQLGYYDCTCPEGYLPTTLDSSNRCIKKNHACDSNPCGPAGSCNPQPDGSHTCDCVPGYKVKIAQGPCQEIIDPCEGNPCGAGGLCNGILGGGYHCTCIPGFILPEMYASFGGRCYPRGSPQYP